jgi:hypothetical protein
MDGYIGAESAAMQIGVYSTVKGMMMLSICPNGYWAISTMHSADRQELALTTSRALSEGVMAAIG